MAEAAIAPQLDTWQTYESEYALSLGRLKSVGRLALSETAEVQLLTGEVAQLRAEFDTSLAEMFKSDDEYGDELEITRFDEYQTSEGRVLSFDGVTFISDMSYNGWLASAALSKEDNRMAPQATRDSWDYWNACEVDAMVQGERPYNTRFVMSLVPEEAIERDGSEYWQDLGYFTKTKTAFLQMFHVFESGEVLQGTLSVDASDKESMRKLWGSLDMSVPDQEISDNWLAYPLVGNMSAEQAKHLALEIRQKHYANVGHTPTKPLSIEKVLDHNKTIVDQSFENLHMSLAKSVALEEKTPAIDELVSTYMGATNDMSPKIRSAMIHCHNSQKFNAADARLVYKLIMYATAEKIRQSLRHEKAEPNQAINTRTLVLDSHRLVINPQSFIHNIVSAAHEGIREKRSYGSCGMKVSLTSKDELNSLEANFSPWDNDDNHSEYTDEKGKKKWMSCPHCKARVYDDPCAKILSCGDCSAKVVNGVVTKGDGGSRKRKAENIKKIHAAKNAGKNEKVPEARLIKARNQERQRLQKSAGMLAVAVGKSQ